RIGRGTGKGGVHLAIEPGHLALQDRELAGERSAIDVVRDEGRRDREPDDHHERKATRDQPRLRAERRHHQRNNPPVNPCRERSGPALSRPTTPPPTIYDYAPRPVTEKGRMAPGGRLHAPR